MPTPQISFSHSETYEEALHRAAEHWGIELSYWDIWGKQHHATTEGIAAVLSSLGVDTSSAATLDEAVLGRLVQSWNRLIPPTLVLSAAAPVIPLRASATAVSPLTLSIRFENGETHEESLDIARLAIHAEAMLDGTHSVERRAEIEAARGRLGYHELTLSVPGAEPVRCRLILCPDRAYLPGALDGDGRAGGLAVSLYGLRSDRNWGCGDFSDLKALAGWVAHELGASFIGLNPLHAIPNRQPYNTSPYLPACAFYKNFIYLDLTAIPDFDRSPLAQSIVKSEKFQEQLRLLREAPHVEYEKVARLKLRFLKLLFRVFQRELRSGGTRAESFRRFVAEEGQRLEDWAIYSALDERLHKSNPAAWLWTDWPQAYHDARSESVSAFARQHRRLVEFYKYIQWNIDLQLAAAQEHARASGMAIGLYHDLALATDRFGGDFWAHRPFYVEGCRVGAPPDDFSPNGQDWSFPPPNGDAHFRDGYRLFSDSIRKNLRHGGALRIDHVMRFFHLFWIPDSLGDARRGIYVRDRHEDLVRILALESVRNQVLVVGEDLGTVADQVRETLSRFGILSYRLFYFEKWGDGRMRLPHEYPKQALVSASTHDLPTIRGFWECRDIEARRRVGMFRSDDDYHAQVAARAADKQRMLDVLFTLGLLPNDRPRSAADYPELTGELHNAIVGFIAATPSTLMVMNEEDLMKQPDQQNLPGTTAEYPNWRHKTRFRIEELWSSPAIDFARMYHGWLRTTSRTTT